ncbi:hypothetical protein D3C75_977830 [compost metagenome]
MIPFACQTAGQGQCRKPEPGHHDAGGGKSQSVGSRVLKRSAADDADGVENGVGVKQGDGGGEGNLAPSGIDGGFACSRLRLAAPQGYAHIKQEYGACGHQHCFQPAVVQDGQGHARHRRSDQKSIADRRGKHRREGFAEGTLKGALLKNKHILHAKRENQAQGQNEAVKGGGSLGSRRKNS